MGNQPLHRSLHGLRRRRWWWLAGLGVALLGIVAGGLVARQRQRDLDSLVQQVLRLSAPIPGADEHCPAWLIADDIHVILSAVQDYYVDHQSYPPFLFGGQSEFRFGGTMAGAKVAPGPNPDPLLVGGYLKNYPKLPLLGSDCKVYRFPTDPRTSDYWMCAYSTPGDWQALGTWDPETPFDANTRAGSPDDLESLRILTLSGRTSTWHRYWAKALTDQYPDSSDCWFTMCCDFRRDLLYFGYSRGEWFGAGPDECWLWFYGSPLWLELGEVLPATEAEVGALLERKGYQAREFAKWLSRAGNKRSLPTGLDLIDSATGELEPDGCPDSIFLLYRLRDGNVVETVSSAEK